jgi:hypothetical protein
LADLAAFFLAAKMPAASTTWQQFDAILKVTKLVSKFSARQRTFGAGHFGEFHE